jgi:hypothetical protein
MSIAERFLEAAGDTNFRVRQLSEDTNLFAKERPTLHGFPTAGAFVEVTWKRWI